ncbi:hypothetical protein BU24DRAFT_479686 [Aaosphaeria arxii CBS 175.79]|uniref:NAD(P)-binding protein n=1 Tax=Aaosphaeria arxii CBS 175.79 TaxID=1450172 RepID=A0A6A5XZY6_9PLEO|nr:uncharacterized protein BU24DRAFT_479686 [Aaosphaeria arxii CBS 175.79]KAF2018271.1 hypothetical protein BU24DRAFT_479686 [Aaosphaeria arxii CBS 175.79]
MVTYSTIVASNAHFAEQHHLGRVCVFAGATAGIGLATLKKIAFMLHESMFYILGRSRSRFSDQLAGLTKINPSNVYQFVEEEVSLMSAVDAACHSILTSETKIDYLCMSSGGIPWQGPVYTKEGLEANFAISYFSRIRLVSNLLPLLQKSEQPHVLSILNGTKEKRIKEDDIGLEKSWGIVPMIDHSTLLTSLAFDYLATIDHSKRVVYLHVTPGLVNTGSRKQRPDTSKGWFRWLGLLILSHIADFMVRLTGMSLDESGERHAYVLTSGQFEPGSWRLDKLNDVIPDNDAVVSYRNAGWADKIWNFTEREWTRALSAM